MQIPLFSHQSFNQIKKLTNLFNFENILRGQMLMEQGQLPSKIYLIHEGEFEILRKKRN